MEKIKNEELKDNRICRALIEPQPEGADFDFVAVAVPAENGQINYNVKKPVMVLINFNKKLFNSIIQIFFMRTCQV